MILLYSKLRVIYFRYDFSLEKEIMIKNTIAPYIISYVMINFKYIKNFKLKKGNHRSIGRKHGRMP